VGSRYIPALDGVRAIAVLAVICSHTLVPGMEPGKWGVDIFFVLSGYLITTILKGQAEAGGIGFGAFYLRRLRRLYPALLTMLALYLAVFPWLFPDGHQMRDATFAAVYLTDYTVALLAHVPFMHTDPAIAHTWSLSVEEHFYLLWPLVVAGIARIRTRRFVVYALVAAYIGVTAWRLYSHVEYGWQETYSRFDTRCTGLILGSLLAYVPELKHRAWGWAVPPLVLLVWWLTPDKAHLISPWPILAAEWCGVALVMWAATRPKWLEWPPLVYVGTISYGLYLYHWPVAHLLRHYELPAFLPALVLSFALAHFSARYIEAPFRYQVRGTRIPQTAG